jgi:cytochrome c-type biogenesis protein CcmH/NrfG
MSKGMHLLDRVSSFIIILSLVVTPLFFLTITQDYYEVNKNMLLLVSALVVLLLSGFKMLLRDEFSVKISKSAVGFAFLTLTYGISIIIASANKIEAVLMPIGMTTFASLTVVSLVGTSVLHTREKSILRWGLIASAVLLALIAIYQFIGVGKALATSLPFLTDKLWTPAGSSVGLLAVLVLAAATLTDEIKKKRNEVIVILSIVFAVLIAGGFVVTLISFIPQFTSQVLPLNAGWSITMEVLKNPKAALFGVGAENFISAFTAGRPVYLNMSTFWTSRYGLNSTMLLHIIATTGIIGLLAVLAFFKQIFSKKNVILCLTMIGAVLVLSPSISLLSAITALLLATNEGGRVISIKIPEKYAWLRPSHFILMLGVVGIATFFFGRAYYAETVFQQSLVAARANNGTNTYNLLIKSIGLEPSVNRYHIAYSQTNLLLANSIAQNASKNATDSASVSDQDKQTVATLTQQAIREGKLATDLAPTSVIAWENLAAIYQNLIGVAQNADQWAVASLQRAIQLDPTNPSLRYAIAMIYLKQGNQDAALSQLLASIDLKSDYVSSLYAISQVYKQRKENLKSASVIQKVLELLPSDDKNRTQVETELAELKKTLSPSELDMLSCKTPTETPTPPVQNNTQAVTATPTPTTTILPRATTSPTTPQSSIPTAAPLLKP